jgi:hypothetical protein
VEENAIEDFDLIEVIALCSEELAPMVDLGLYDGVIVAFERDLWPVRFEQVLIHTEAWAE